MNEENISKTFPNIPELIFGYSIVLHAILEVYKREAYYAALCFCKIRLIAYYIDFRVIQIGRT